uniref:Uncharacterized protein n=1 Tax=Candidatus Kentrum sp. TUN TaxID=2126343 RepID=A0A450ZF36_9GAMM|nr:MAG: hypothetical protein BECKTUN1418F_GA0071002_10082 [Candidatus Kentron sp. TUN]VFK52899.1 MAG: hypothetical protein BECKTUN1418E_GA0071001_10112 [Candidatus Kentron sp. TUN]
MIQEREQEQQEGRYREENATNVSRPIGTAGEKKISEAQAYIMKQVDRQTERFAEEVESIKHIGKKLQWLITEISTLLEGQNREHYLRGIYDATVQNGFALRETAWAAIDQEENVEILKSLFALSMIDNKEMQFWHWRIHILDVTTTLALPH